MAIINLGSKQLIGKKIDRVSDSLGSSADGLNSGITLVKGGGSVTGNPTTDLSSAIGSWTKVPNSGSFLAVDSGNNEIDVAYGSSANNAINYDLGAGSNLGTKFTVRFEYQITGYSGLGNYMQFAVGLTSGTSNCIQNSNDFAVASNTAGSSLNRWRLHTGKSDQISGGAGNGVVSAFTTTSSATTYYMEIARDGEFFQITFFTDNSYSTVSESIRGSSSGTYNLRYLQASIYQESSGSGTYTSSIRNIKYWNNQAKFNGDVKLGSGAYSFDGSNDRVTTDQRVNGLHDGTGGSVVLWVNPTSSADNDIIFNTHNGSGSGVGVEIKFDSSNRIKVASTNSSNGWVTVNSTTALSNGTWYHVAVTLDTDTKYRIYINGTLEATSSAFTTKTADSTNPYYLGDSPDSGNYYDGLLDDVGIYSRALTATEISALYNSGTGALVSSLSNKAGLKAHYTMDTQGTAAWTGFTKTSDSNLNSYEQQPRGCTISSDGVYFYVIGDQGHSIDQFTMSTPYDLSTASHTRVESIGNNPRGIYFKEDGTKMFITFYGGIINRYSLSTAWDISTKGSSDQSDTFESDSTDKNATIGLFFKPDGTKFYTAISSDNAIKEYTCGSAWDVSSMSGSPTATRDSLQGDVSGLFISSDGLRIWYCDYATDKVYQWNLTTAWDIGSGSADSTSYSVEANPFGFTMKTDGTKFYLVNDGEDEIQEFTGGKSCPNDFSATSDLEAMTNLPTNSIFLQMDDTPSYWWKQSDNTWLQDFKYPNPLFAAFSTADSSGFVAGGTTSGSGSVTNAAQTWNGTTWANMTDFSYSANYGLGGGNATDAIVMGGSSTTGGAGGSSPRDDSTKWNGSSWSATSDMSTGRNMNAGGGNSSSAMCWGGTYSQLNSTDTFNGSAWSAGGNLAEGIRGANGDAANNDNAFSVAGYNGSSNTTTTQKYNSGVWTTVSPAIGSSSVQGDHGGCGTPNSFLSATTSTSSGSIDYWNGTTWGTTANTVNGRRSIYGGDGGKAFKVSGDNVGNTNSEYYDGTTWANKGTMETHVRAPAGAGGNT